VALAGALLVAAGCGDGDGSGGSSAGDYVDAITDSFGEEAGLNDEAKRCVAEAYVEVIGVEDFKDAGVSPQDIRDDPDASPEEMGLELDEEQVAELSEAALKCPGIPGG
jgi:hypothetical protein